MIFYEVKYVTEDMASKVLMNSLPELGSKKSENAQLLNANLYEEVSVLTTMVCTAINENTFVFVLATYLWDKGKAKLLSDVKRWLRNVLHEKGRISMEQITADDFVKSIMSAEIKDYLIIDSYRIKNNLDINYFDNRQFNVEEYMINDAPFSKKKALEQARKYLADRTLLEELERIYSDVNPREFYGHPVHYKINCSSLESGMEIVDLLVNALHDRKRLCGCRINLAHDITPGCYDEYDFADFILAAKGNVVVIDTRGIPDSSKYGRYASVYEEVIQYMDGIIRRYCGEVLFILLENNSNPGFSKALMAHIKEYLKIVDIYEGIGNPSQALEYLNYLASESELMKYWDNQGKEIPLLEKAYTATELRKLFIKWGNECLSKSVYYAYADYQQIAGKPQETFSGNKLEELVGLEQVKRITKQIIATNVIAKRRMQTRSGVQTTSKHMIFTGNPGSAKTTVARILANLLKEEGVLESGAFVECGRADLVGKYVGWTAQIVKKKFMEARGGVLFIDEAYSMVEENGQFGDEAINTIVQEMENYRDEVMVIFAGYPDRMKDFIDKNEGLKSRIAFYVDFPDYSVEELLLIMDLMVKKREYTLTEAARKKAKALMQKGCSNKDFGNGRFVRNVVEQAIMKQSLRLYEEIQSGKDISDEELSLLREEDLEVEDILPKEESKHIVGFRVA